MSRLLVDRAGALLQKERGTVYKDVGGRVSVCLVYPNTYQLGMSNLGFQGIYTMLNERDDVVCERAFLPAREDLEEFERTSAELFALESKRPLGRFDIIAFSVSFENDYVNILKVLSLAHIPLLSKDRAPHHPLVVMGGACALMNPEPVSEFFDICFIGEAEEMMGEFMDAYRESGTKAEVLEHAVAMEGVYVPSKYRTMYAADGSISKRVPFGGAPEKITRRYVLDISRYALRPSIVTPETEFSRMHLVEAMRGCPHSCNFCLAGQVYNPPRKKALDAIKEEISAALGQTDRVGLIGPSLTDYPHARDVLGMEGVDFSITSLRASGRSADLVALMHGRKSVSIAPEAGSERLRRVINKKITEADIMETSARILDSGIKRLRLYFMVGLPKEAGEDMEAIVELVGNIRKSSAKGSITLTLSTFVPKPFTPFQWHPMEDMKTVKERLRFIKKELSGLKEVKVFHDVPKYSYMQGMLARGDRRVAAALRAMLAEGDWHRQSVEAGVEPEFYSMRARDFDEQLPWDFIDTGISREMLWERYREAVA